jgi:PLP dependent protein
MMSLATAGSYALMIERSEIAENLSRVREHMAEAALQAGRDPAAVHLVAVTKTFPAAVVVEALHAGQRYFGENRPEEGLQKIRQVRQWLNGPGGTPLVTPVWHMIGHVQSRKADVVAENFDVVHSIDRIKVAHRLSARALALQREIPVLLECNVSGEVSKYGYRADGWDRDPDVRRALSAEVAAVADLPGLRIEGLMTVAPVVDEAESVRAVFASLRGLRDALRDEFPSLAWHHLSMGMTDDFEVAIAEGATLVRIGRAIFGARPYA